MLTEILIIFLLFLANGAFSMAEMAVVLSNKARLRVLVEEGHQVLRHPWSWLKIPIAYSQPCRQGILSSPP